MSIIGVNLLYYKVCRRKDTLRIYFRISIFAPLKEKVYER